MNTKKAEHTPGIDNKYEEKANAALISAEPEMLAALTNLVRIENRAKEPPTNKDYDQARAAIAKAEGK